MRVKIANDGRFRKALVLVAWGTLLYSMPVVVQPYSTSLLASFSNSFSILYTCVSLGALGAFLIGDLLGAQGIREEQFVHRTLWALGAIATAVLLIANVAALSALAQHESPMSIPHWALQFAGTSFFSYTSLLCIVSGYGFADYSLADARPSMVAEQPNPISAKSVKRASNLLLVLGAAILGCLRAPLLCNMAPKSRALFHELTPLYGCADTSFAAPAVVFMIIGAVLFVDLLLARQRRECLEAFFLGDVLGRMVLRLRPALLNECLRPTVLGMAVLFALTCLAVGSWLSCRPGESCEDSKATKNQMQLPREYHALLTPRESESIELMIQGMTSAQIAEVLGIKASTVRGFQQRAYKKIGCSGASEFKQLCADSSKVKATSQRLSDVCEVANSAIQFKAEASLVALVAFLPIDKTGPVACLIGVSGWNRSWGAPMAIGMALCLFIFLYRAYFAKELDEIVLGRGDVSVLAAFPVIIGLETGELWRSAVWPYISFADGLGLLLAGLTIMGICLTWKNLGPRLSRGEIVLVTAVSLAAWMCTGSIWATAIVFGAWAYLKEAKLYYGGPLMREVFVLGCRGLAGGLFGSAFCLTSCGDAISMVARLGVLDHMSHLSIVKLMLMAAVITSVSVSYIMSLRYKCVFCSLQSNERVLPEKTEMLFAALGLSAVEAKVGSRLALGEPSRAVAQTLKLSPGTVNAAKRRVYAKMGVHSALQLKSKLESLL